MQSDYEGDIYVFMIATLSENVSKVKLVVRVYVHIPERSSNDRWKINT
jgi:hypothetical protein